MSAGADGGAPSDPAVVGRVVRPHGLAGDVVVAPDDPSSPVCSPGSRVWLAGRWRRILDVRSDNKGRWVMRLEAVENRDQAEAVRDEALVIEAGELPVLEEGKYYIHDLVGCRVEDPQGRAIGEVVGVARGPQDWLEIAHRGGRSLVPMVPEMLQQVNVVEARIVLDLPEGLMEATRG